MRAWLNALRRRMWRLLIHRMVFGERSADGLALPFTRISPSTCIEHEDKLMLADHVFIGHFNFIEASASVRIDEGVQVTNFVSIVTHSSHASLRVMGRSYANGRHERVGLISGPIHIGAYSFIGPHSLIEAGSTLGKGCVVAAYSAVRGDFPDFSLIRGIPAERVGDTREADLVLLDAHPELKEQYLAWAGSMPREGA